MKSIMKKNQLEMKKSKKSRKNIQVKTDEFETSVVMDMDESEILESYSNKSFIHQEELKKMNYRQLKELMLFYELEGDVERFEIARKFLAKKKEDPIEFAPIGLRIWSYYYEKNLFRLAVGAWVLFWVMFIKPFLTYKMKWEQYDHFLTNVKSASAAKYLANGIPLAGVLLVLGILLLWAGWRLWMAYLESSKNKSWGHSTFYRRKIRLIIVDSHGEFLPMKRLLLRGAMKMFPFYAFSLVYMQFHGRGFHDILSDTYVLKVTGDPDPVKIRQFIAEKSVYAK